MMLSRRYNTGSFSSGGTWKERTGEKKYPQGRHAAHMDIHANVRGVITLVSVLSPGFLFILVSSWGLKDADASRLE